MKVILVSDSGQEYLVSEEDYSKAPMEAKADLFLRLMAALEELKKTEYDTAFGDDKVCKCGHAYYRHFDTYEDMRPIGCKYCPCDKFEEPKTGFDKYVAQKMQDPAFAEGYKEAVEEIATPSWSNTINYKFKFWGEVSVFFDKMVVPSGYPFFLWNDRIYKRTGEDSWEDTNLTIEDLK